MRLCRSEHGFTLIELIMVIVISAVLATTLVIFLKPAMDSYLTSRARADLSDQADTALRRMVRDVRLAVPNSIRTPGAQCFELVPTSSGGRYRAGPDTVNDSGPDCAAGVSCAAQLDTSRATTVFDVLTPLASTPLVGDWVVVGNQTPGDIYGGVDRAAITGVATPNAAYGRLRLSITPNTQFPLGYASGRFSVVPNAQQAVFYVCSGADGSLDATGNGKGTLARVTNGFIAAYPSTCPVAGAGAVLATRVRSCKFLYDPNQGATQQNGFVWMELELARNGEAARLAMGAHVANGP